MKSLRRQPDADAGAGARPLAPPRWDWSGVRRVLVVRLRSIGDTVLATPSLGALRRFLPQARIDVLLEDWVAPLLEGSGEVDRVVTVARGSSPSRIRVARLLRAERYDPSTGRVTYSTNYAPTAAKGSRGFGEARPLGFGDPTQFQVQLGLRYRL